MGMVVDCEVERVRNRVLTHCNRPNCLTQRRGPSRPSFVSLALFLGCLPYISYVNGFHFPQSPNNIWRKPASSERHQSRSRVVDAGPPLRICEETTSTGGQVTTQLDRDDNLYPLPTTMPDAAKTFLLAGDQGPCYVIMSIAAFTSWRASVSSLGWIDVALFVATVLFWSFQEHFLHERLLHSSFDWRGKDIHQTHHDKPYYHISIDPAPLLLGWMLCAHLALRAVLPLPLALTATIAYSLSGLFYEWSHYVVHTKVRFRSSFWKRVKENHLRHHVVCDKYWFAFSLPYMDDIFGTNPSIRQVRHQQEEDRRR